MAPHQRDQGALEKWPTADVEQETDLKHLVRAAKREAVLLWYVDSGADLKMGNLNFIRKNKQTKMHSELKHTKLFKIMSSKY